MTTVTAEAPKSMLDSGVPGWIHRRLFSSIPNAVVTILIAWLALMILPAAFDWLVTSSVIHADSTRACRAIDHGACWALIVEKHRLILFGLYPYDEQWRPLIVVGLFLVLIGVSCSRRFWNWHLAPIWVVGLAAIGGLVYAHRKRGGQMTLESFKQSGRDLLDGIKGKASDIRSEAESRLHEVAGKVSEKTDKSSFGSSSGSKLGEDVTGYGSSGYGYSGSDSNRTR